MNKKPSLRAFFLSRPRVEWYFCKIMQTVFSILLRDLFGFPIWSWMLVGIICLLWVIQFIYLLKYHWPLGKIRAEEHNLEQPGVSIVVSARNEEKNLMMNLPKWMEQDYPNFEVIVVNDTSYDDTADILNALAVSYPRLHVIHIDEEKQNMQGKKFALTLGIKGAKNEIILFTDADCSPRSNNWISSIVARHHSGVEIVLGYSPFEKRKGWVNKLARFDNALVGLQYLGAAKAGRPYMGVGRNLSYTQSVFFKVGGFRSHYSLISGDDDLLINQVAKKGNTAIAYDLDAQTISPAKSTMAEWRTQKKRHFSTSPHYKGKDKRWLSIFPTTWFLMHALSLFTILLVPMLYPVLALIFLRNVLVWAVYFRFAKVTQQPTDIAWLSPLLEAQLMFLHVSLYFSNLISKPQKWS